MVIFFLTPVLHDACEHAYKLIERYVATYQLHLVWDRPYLPKSILTGLYING